MDTNYVFTVIKLMNMINMSNVYAISLCIMSVFTLMVVHLMHGVSSNPVIKHVTSILESPSFLLDVIHALVTLFNQVALYL